MGKDDLLTSTQAAKELKVHRITAFRAAAAGLVPGARRESRPGTINAPWVATRTAWREWYENRRPVGRPRRDGGELAQRRPPLVALSLVRPESPKTETIAEIAVKGDIVTVTFPERREEFRLLMRSLGYEWTGTRWARPIRSIHGEPADRAAETGHRLLAAGFVIRIDDEVIRNRAITGNYRPEPNCWVQRIVAGEHAGKFMIGWTREADLYGAAKRISGSRYVPGKGIVVPPEHFDEVLDFAEMHGAYVSPAALELANEARAIRDAAPVVKVRAPKKRRAPDPKAPPRLEAPVEVNIADDLRDDDETS